MCVYMIGSNARTELAVELPWYCAPFAGFAPETSLHTCTAVGVLWEVGRQVIDAHSFRPQLRLAHTTTVNLRDLLLP